MNRIAFWFERQWTTRTAWQIVLRPLSWLFRVVSATRRWAYRRGWIQSHRLPVTVIIVGNITVGGSGKTPLVIWLVEKLRAAGYVPGVIGRGYGGSESGPFEVGPFSDAAEVGDEPLLIAARTDVPLFIGRNRVAAGQALLEAFPNCDVIICDDGLQHYRLQRDIEIAVVDAAAGFGNGCFLPAGPLREPVGRLATVNSVVINGGRGAVDAANLGSLTRTRDQLVSTGWPWAMRLSGHVFCNVLDPESHALVADLRHFIVHVVAGIGRPKRFFDHLRQLGFDVIEHPFPDHHAYRREDLAFGDDGIILMTEKDAVKCKAFAEKNWWMLPVTAELDDHFLASILKKLRPTYGPQTA